MNRHWTEAFWIIIFAIILGILFNLSRDKDKKISFINKPLEIKFTSDSSLNALINQVKVNNSDTISKEIKSQIEKISEAKMVKKNTSDEINIKVAANVSELKMEKKTSVPKDVMKTPDEIDEKNTKSTIPFINYNQLLELMNKPNIALIDARSPEMYAKGKIGTAINIYPYMDKQNEFYALINNLERSKVYIVYCDGGTCELSHEVSDVMIKFGFEHVFIYHGGWNEWEPKLKK